MPYLQKIKGLQLILIAFLGFLLSFAIPALLAVNAQESAIALLQNGKQYYHAQQFTQASKTLKQAANIAQTNNNLIQQVQALNFISLAQQKLGEWEAATTAIEQSLSLLRNLPPSRELHQVHAQAVNVQAHLQLAQGNATAALKSWQDAEKIYNQASDRQGIMGSQINQALALQALGLNRRALQILTQIEQQLQEQPDSALKASGLLNIGNMRRQARELERSQAILQTSVAVAQTANLPQLQTQALLSLANTEIALARKAREVKNTKNIAKYTQQAINHYQQVAQKTNSPLLKLQAQINQLTVFIESQQKSLIPELLPKITTSLPELSPSRAAVYAQVNLAENLLKLGWENPDILPILNNAIKQAQNLVDKRAESYAIGTLGNFYEKQLNWSKALEITESALLIAQAHHAQDIAYQWQWQMGRILQSQAETKSHTREANVKAINYYTAAFQTLNNLRSDLVALNPEIQFSFRESVEPVYRQLVDLLLRSPQPSREYLIQARNIIEALQLAELDNFFGDACAKPAAVNIDNLDPNAAVIYPIILPDRLEIIVKLPGIDNLRHYSHENLTSDQVDAAITQLSRSIKRRSTSLGRIKQESQEFYDWLIKPFATELETTINREQSQIKNLIFILDGALRNLPMSVLYDGEKYVIERYAISVTSGLQLLEPKPLNRESLNVLIGGATNAPSFEQEGLNSIENVAVEITGITAEVRNTQTLKNQAFIQENIRKQIKSRPFNVVHLATHGKFSSNSEETYILDWKERIKVKDLEQLLSLDYQRSTKPIELLILSACETAAGDNRAALGLAGIAISAGARSTLATLWQINDASTATFMIKFYQELNQSEITKAEALRNVQLAFLNEFPSTDFDRPFHWASFILVGNWL
jgi:CHAT domain-containing protein